MELDTTLKHSTVSEEVRLQKMDPWFYAHYVYAANIVASKLRNYTELSNCNIFDFGCGDGITSLGVNHHVGSVTGLDVTEAFLHLTDKVLPTLGLAELPNTLHFVRVNADSPLPFDENHFDGGYSWSVFEHVTNVKAALSEVHRILKPGTPFFLQIEPLYASPFGSHLKRLIDEPWAHLLMDEASYLERALAATDTVPENEKDIMYRTSEFENVKKYLIGEYRSLNRITVDQIISHVLRTGFHIREMQTSQVMNYAIPGVLLDAYSEYDLRTNEVIMVISK